MTRAPFLATITVALFAAAAITAFAANSLRITPAPPAPAGDQPQLSEAQMAAGDHETLRTAIATMCDDPAQPEAAHPRTAFQLAALAYSNELKNQRIKIASQIEQQRFTAWNYQLGIIGFGTLATILIGLRPLADKLNRDTLSTIIAAAAIIFSGLVTSTSSLSAIAAGQIDLLHNQRTLAQLQQLHWRIDHDVFATAKLCDPNGADMAKIDSWKDRFEKITDEAMPIVAQPGDLRQPPGTMPADRPPQAADHPA